MIEKNYQPADIESRMARLWEESGAFKAGRPERLKAEPFTMVTMSKWSIEPRKGIRSESKLRSGPVSTLVACVDV